MSRSPGGAPWKGQAEPQPLHAVEWRSAHPRIGSEVGSPWGKAGSGLSPCNRELRDAGSLRAESGRIDITPRGQQ